MPKPLRSRESFSKRLIRKMSIVFFVGVLVLYAVLIDRIFSMVEDSITQKHKQEAARIPHPLSSRAPRELSPMEAVRESTQHVERVLDGLEFIFPMKDNDTSSLVECHVHLNAEILRMVYQEDVRGALQRAEHIWRQCQSHILSHPSLRMMETLMGLRSMLMAAGASADATHIWKDRADKVVSALSDEVKDLSTFVSSESGSKVPLRTVGRAASLLDLTRHYAGSDAVFNFTDNVLLTLLDHHFEGSGSSEQNRNGHVGLLGSFVTGELQFDGVASWGAGGLHLLEQILRVWAQCSTHSEPLSPKTRESCDKIGDYYELSAEALVSQLMRTFLEKTNETTSGELTVVGALYHGVWLPLVDRSTCEAMAILAAGVHTGVHRRQNRTKRISFEENDFLNAAEALMSTCANHGQRLRRPGIALHGGLASAFTDAPVAPTVIANNTSTFDRHNFLTVLMKGCYFLYLVTDDTTYSNLAQSLLFHGEMAAPSSAQLLSDLPIAGNYLEDFFAQQRYFALLFARMKCAIYHRKKRGLCSLFRRSMTSVYGHQANAVETKPLLLVERTFSTTTYLFFRFRVFLATHLFSSPPQKLAVNIFIFLFLLPFYVAHSSRHTMSSSRREAPFTMERDSTDVTTSAATNTNSTAHGEDERRREPYRWGPDSTSLHEFSRYGESSKIEHQGEWMEAVRPIRPHFTFTEDLSDHTTTADFTNLPSEGLSTHGSSTSAAGRRRENAAGYHSQADDVSTFHSCIHPSPENHSGVAPRRTGPCSADLLRHVILFVDVSSRSDIIQMGSVCRFWHYHTNFAPHWTAFRKSDWSTRTLNLPKNVRTTVVKPKLVTREEYVEEKKLFQEYRRNDESISRARHIRWCAALGIMVAILLTLNYLVAIVMAIFPTAALSTDTTLGTAVFFVMAFASLLEVAVVVIPLSGSGKLFSQNGMGNMSRVLSWAEVLVALSLVFGIILALSSARVSSLQGMLQLPLYNMTMSANCGTYDGSMHFPSFVALPALLNDLRWRPITADETQEKYVPFCLQDLCFSLLFFDAWYQSEAFQSASGYNARNIGTYTALGYNVFSACRGENKNQQRVSGGATCGPWCALSNHVQIIAITQDAYKTVQAEVESTYPTMQSWLSADSRPTSFAEVTYQTSIASRFVKNGMPQHSTELWKKGPLWEDTYVPLVSTEERNAAFYAPFREHFTWYAYTCLIITGAVWFLMLLAQCVFKEATVVLLGVTTCVTVIFLNPISMIIAGAVCLNLPADYAMCSSAAGGGLVGGGISLLFLVMTIYFSL
eukprot:gene12046-8298_t